MLRLLALVSIFLSAFSSTGHALTINAQDLAKLPAIQVVGVEVDSGPRFASVQPTAFLRVKHSSCAVMPLEAKSDVQSGVLFVTVTLPQGQVDCMAVGTEREYTLQISSDFRPGMRVVVLNPATTFYK